MAGENSARPTGGRARKSWPDEVRDALQRQLVRLSHSKWSAVIMLFGTICIALASTNASAATPTVWPILILGCCLLIATYASYDQNPFLVSNLTASNFLNPLRSNQDCTQTETALSDDSQLNQFSEMPRPQHAHFETPLALTSEASCSDWSDLMSQVSHELRTPLNAMIGFSDAMNAELLGPVDNPRYREYLAHICESGRELLKSTEDTLAMTSLLAGQSAVATPSDSSDLHLTIREAWAFVAPAAQTKEIRLEIDGGADTAVLADVRPLKQTFVNLFSAALHVASDNTAIFIQTRQVADIIEVVMCTKMTKNTRAECTPKLSTLIAQALLELQGTTLHTAIDDETGHWRAMTQFDCRLQSDFFDDHVGTETATAGHQRIH